jgi:hypothetical protein
MEHSQYIQKYKSLGVSHLETYHPGGGMVTHIVLYITDYSCYHNYHKFKLPVLLVALALYYVGYCVVPGIVPEIYIGGVRQGK